MQKKKLIKHLLGKDNHNYGARCLVLLQVSLQEATSGYKNAIKVPEQWRHLTGGSSEVILSNVSLKAWEDASNKYILDHNEDNN